MNPEIKQIKNVHLVVYPRKGTKTCQNCCSFNKFGVHLGYCLLKEDVKLDRNRCKNFEEDGSNVSEPNFP